MPKSVLILFSELGFSGRGALGFEGFFATLICFPPEGKGQGLASGHSCGWRLEGISSRRSSRRSRSVVFVVKLMGMAISFWK